MPQNRIRWDCPNGRHPGVLGPTRPRMDSVVRYCLTCSQQTGRLVLRVAPTLERKRAAKQQREAAARERRRVMRATARVFR
jgi:hypothetical protein